MSQEKPPIITDQVWPPPLYLKHPNWDPAMLAAKKAAELERLGKAHEAFKAFQVAHALRKEAENQKRETEYQHRSQQEVYETRRTYQDNVTGIGYLVRKSVFSEAVAIPHTQENDTFFNYREETERFELRCLHSAQIVALLALHLSAREVLPTDSSNQLPYQGRLAFFDNEGTFYNLAHLVDLKDRCPSSQPKEHAQKHTALFHIPLAGGSTHQFNALEMPIDNICCVAPAAHPFVWEGDYN